MKLSEKLLTFLKQLDQFGVAFQPKIKYSTAQYKTIVGGVVSFILYGLSLAYLIYSLTQWGSGSLLPKITTISQKADQQNIQFTSPIMQFKIRPGTNNKINPFDPQALIMVPLVLPFINNEIPDLPTYLNTSQIAMTSNGIEISNIDLQYGYSDKDEREIIVAFAECNPALIVKAIGFQCASDERKNNFFNQKSNAMIITTFLNQFNTGQKKLETVGKEQVVALVDDATYFQTTNFNIQQSSVDTGFLLESITDYIYATDYYLTSQQLSLSYLNNQFNSNTYVAVQLRIGKLKLFQSIQYSKISEVLADAGSIASTLLLLSYFVIICNSYLLESESLQDIITIYFPGFKDVKIKKSLFGEIKEVTYQNKKQDVVLFKNYYKQLQETAEKKLTISNQIYEISRIQFILQNMNKQQFDDIHKAGLKLREFEEVKSMEELQNLNQIIPQTQLSYSVQKLVIQEATIEDRVQNGCNDDDFGLLVKPD